MLSRHGLARSDCPPTSFLARLLGSRKMVWFGQPFVPPLFPHACWSGCCPKMVWLTQLFVLHTPCTLSRSARSVSCPSPARCALSLPSSRAPIPVRFKRSCLPHALAGLTAVARWSGSVTSLCLPSCFHLSPHLFSHLLGWMMSRDGLARSALCLPTCFQVSSDLSRACWVGFCHEMVWLGQRGQPFVSPLVSTGLDALTRLSGSVSSLSPPCLPS